MPVIILIQTALVTNEYMQMTLMYPSNNSK